MNAVGLIVEYNPFHNGHKLHLEAALEKTKADIVIAVMSSNFIQRGEPSLLSKWKRCEIALLNKVDIVIELPVFYSNQSAEIFAYGAVSILEKLKVKSIVFGSEDGDIKTLKKLAEIQIKEKELFDISIKKYMKNGNSYPNAIAKTLYELSGEEILLKPNNILGIEYIKSILKINSSIKALCIKREKADYHNPDITGTIASATSIRNSLINEEWDKIKEAVPNSTFKILKEESERKKLSFLEDYFELLKYKIISSYDNLKNIQDLEDGFENRLLKSAQNYHNFEEFYNSLLSKRLSNARLKRILCHVLLDITKDLNSKLKENSVPYIRVLGFNEKGSKYLKIIKKEQKLKIITNLKYLKREFSKEELYFLNFETKASSIYNLLISENERKIPLILKEEEVKWN